MLSAGIPAQPYETPVSALLPVDWDNPEPCASCTPYTTQHMTAPPAFWEVPEACVSLPVIAFVPVQRGKLSECVFEPEVAFGMGTLFPTLYKPWRVGYE